MITKLSKAAGYVINTLKSTAFLYTTNEQSKKEIKKTIPFIIIVTKSIKYLGINLTKKVKILYTETIKIFLKQIKGVNNWKDILWSWIRRLK